MNSTDRVCFDVKCPVCGAAVTYTSESMDCFCNKCVTIFTWNGCETKELNYQGILQLVKANQLSCEEVLQVISKLCDEECTCTPDQQSGKDATECLSCAARGEYNDVACDIRNAAKSIIKQKLALEAKLDSAREDVNTIVEGEQICV